MKVGFLVLAALANLVFGAVLGILSAPLLGKMGKPRGQLTQEPWEKSLDDFMRASHGPNDPAVIRGMTHHITLSVRKLAREVADFNESTNRLGTANLILAIVIAGATAAYATVVVLQYALPK